MSKKKSILLSQPLISIIVFTYLLVFGISSCKFFSEQSLSFIIGSIYISAFVIFLRSTKSLSRVFKVVGDMLMILYIVGFGLASYFILKGLDLLIFYCSYIFAISIFYIKDPARIKD